MGGRGSGRGLWKLSIDGDGDGGSDDEGLDTDDGAAAENTEEDADDDVEEEEEEEAKDASEIIEGVNVRVRVRAGRPSTMGSEPMDSAKECLRSALENNLGPAVVTGSVDEG